MKPVAFSRGLLPAALCLAAFVLVGWLGIAADGTPKPAEWTEVVPGIFRTQSSPTGYALVDGNRALLIDAPHPPAGLRQRGVEQIDGVWLTHHHRDSCAAASQLRGQGVAVRAAKLAAEWLLPAQVRKYWQDGVPLRNSRAAYLVVARGIDGVDCTLEDGQVIEWHGWTIRVIATPGHAKDHLAFLAQRGPEGKRLVFCGDALAAPGKLWTPYTTDWDHWTDAGLKPAEASLRKLAALRPDLLLPAHGPPITANCVAALERTADAVAEVAFLKSFERYTKQRLGGAPTYRFLAKEQAESNGSKPWSQISEHLFLTGNTYVLTSRTDNALLVIDPWDKRSADQVARLKHDRGLGRLEVVLFSHAHYDHYDGVYHLPDRESFQVWTLDRVATPIAEPFRFRAPFLDARPVRFDRLLRDGETATWREYSFRFHHLPGQSYFTMGVEAIIGGKRCYFTADNFFHQDQFSGTGGWMGLNRSFPLPYAASAARVLAAAPEWVLAEHGGPFEFNAEDFRRRVRWGEASAVAADALCLSGNHRHDWDPNRIAVEPLLQRAKPGDVLQAKLRIVNPLPRAQRLTIRLNGSDWLGEQAWSLDVPARETVERAVTFRLREKTPPGRHVFPLEVRQGDAPDAADVLFLVDVAP